MRDNRSFFNLDFKGILWKRSLIIWHLNLLWYIKVSQKNIVGFLVRLKEQKDFCLSVKPCISESWICTCTAVSSSFSSSHFFSLFQYSCSASSTSVSFFSHFLSLFSWIFNKVNVQFWGFRKLRWDYLSMDLHFSYENYLSSFNDWQSRLTIESCLTFIGFVAPFWARAVFCGLIPPCLSIPVVVQPLRYGCQFWTVSHKVEEN